MQAIIDSLLIALRGIKRHGAKALEWGEKETKAIRDWLILFVIANAVLMALGVAIAWIAWEIGSELGSHPWLQARMLFVENVGGGIVAVGVIVSARGAVVDTVSGSELSAPETVTW